MKQQLRVKFNNKQEIRMGSPYNMCEITFSGEWIPVLPKDNWQDIKAASANGRYIALVQWNTKQNQPGFHIVRIDTQLKNYHKTKRIFGLCQKVYWEDGKFKWEKS